MLANSEQLVSSILSKVRRRRILTENQCLKVLIATATKSRSSMACKRCDGSDKGIIIESCSLMGDLLCRRRTYRIFAWRVLGFELVMDERMAGVTGAMREEGAGRFLDFATR